MEKSIGINQKFAIAVRTILLAGTVSVVPAFASALDSNILSGDQLFSVRTATSGAAEALARYEAAFEGPDKVEAKRKAARALHWLGDHAEKKRDKAAFFEKGIVHAKEAVAAEPNNPDAHFWLAALYGSYGESRGVLKSLSLVGPIRQELETINRIDESYQGGGGHRVLGVVDYKVPGFAGGSRKRAKKSLQRALELGPDNPYNLYYMAEFLVETGDKKEAISFLDRLVNATVSADVDAPDLASIQRKGEVLGKRLR